MRSCSTPLPSISSNTLQFTHHHNRPTPPPATQVVVDYTACTTTTALASMVLHLGMPNPPLTPCVTLYTPIAAIHGKYYIGKYNIFPPYSYKKNSVLCILQRVYFKILDTKQNENSISAHIATYAYAFRL